MKFKSLLMLFIFIASLIIAIFSAWYDILLDPDNQSLQFILYQMRIPSVLMCAVSGAGLSLSGLTYQYLFQNHLASPYTLGIASAAAFGSSLFVLIDSKFIELPFYFQSLFSLTIAFLTVLLLLRFMKKSSADELYRVLLAGVALSLLFSSVIILIQYLLGSRDGFELMVSLLGDVSVVGYGALTVSFILLLFLLLYFYYFSPTLRLLSVNAEYLSGHKKNLKKFMGMSVIVPSIFLSFIVTQVGPISFVGLVVPHIVRIVFKLEGKNEIIGNVLIGGSFLILCNFLSKNIISNLSLPVGIFTSILGGLFLIVSLIRRPGY